MFNWICPQCGRDVLPSYTECPDCSKKTPAGAPAMPPVASAGNPAAPPQTWSGPAQPPAYTPPPPPANYPPQQPPEPVYQQAPPVYQQAPQQPVYQQQPQQQPVYQQPAYQQPAYQQPAYQQPPAYQPPPQYAAQRPPAQARGGFLHGMPTWLLTVLFAVVFGAVGMGIYWWLGSSNSSGSAAATPAATVENPAAKTGAKTNPLQKYVEISGVRFTEDAKKNILVKFILTNHSDSDLSGLAGNATIWGRTQKSEEDAVGTFSFAADVGPETFKEVSAPLTTKLKIYELPDWQNVTTDLQITSPQ